LSIADPNAGAVVVWRFSDGRRGHDNQSLGLVEALSVLLQLEVHTVEVSTSKVGVLDFFCRRFPATDGLPTPQLIIGAGHATHWPMLAARRVRGGRVVVLMNPSLPRSWFDLCIISRHDGVREAANVVLSEGAINRVRPSDSLDATKGLVLIGGVSAHYHWDDAGILSQLRAVIDSDPHIEWLIADSPRTPASFAALTREFLAACGRAKYVHYRDVEIDWLPASVVEAGTIWVSEDSVSMLYEALSTGASVGLLRLRVKRDSRVAAGVSELMDSGRCLSVEDWKRGKRRVANASPLREAERCAGWIAQRWFADRNTTQSSGVCKS
jgi:mitochondrial fission protein ELM1